MADIQDRLCVPRLVALAAASATAAWLGLGAPGLRALKGKLQERHMKEARQVLEDAVTRGRERMPVTVVPSVDRVAEQGLRFFKDLTSTLQRSLKMPSQSGPEGLAMETLAIRSEETGTQGQVPLVIYFKEQVAGDKRPLPAVIYIHATGDNKEAVDEQLKHFAGMGFLAVGMDCRHHGERGDEAEDVREGYNDALVRSWEGSGEKPFLLDNVWDVMHVIDYLQSREDVDGARIGLSGISLGGMITWFTAVIDTRIAAAVPLIGVQGFKWALDHNQWHARYQSIPKVFEAAAKAAGKEGVDSSVVKAVWHRLLPGLLEKYDAPFSLPCIAPRPLLILNGQDDPRCPVGGLIPAVNSARLRYHLVKQPGNFEVYVQTNCGHLATEQMHAATYAFMQRHLQPEGRQTEPAAV